MANTKTKTKESVDISYPSRFKVIIHNDDFTPVEFVIQLLVEIFNKTIDEANDITMLVHTQGSGIAGVYSYEVAEQKLHEASLIIRHKGHPLLVEIEAV